MNIKISMKDKHNCHQSRSTAVLTLGAENLRHAPRHCHWVGWRKTVSLQLADAFLSYHIVMCCIFPLIFPVPHDEIKRISCWITSIKTQLLRCERHTEDKINLSHLEYLMEKKSRPLSQGSTVLWVQSITQLLNKFCGNVRALLRKQTNIDTKLHLRGWASAKHEFTWKISAHIQTTNLKG